MSLALLYYYTRKLGLSGFETANYTHTYNISPTLFMCASVYIYYA